MKSAVFVAMLAACFGCSVPSDGEPVEQVETDVPVYQADCRVECRERADTCGDSSLSCGKCGDTCDANGKRGVCDTCCEGEDEVLRCRPIE
ncbi:MAG: hypothetical protein K0Q89_854 [Thermomicrobiales bacterium]|jgi:hypothetical protein|nr:hypothetical protein [Thermomicrobiales bacterium]